MAREVREANEAAWGVGTGCWVREALYKTGNELT